MKSTPASNFGSACFLILCIFSVTGCAPTTNVAKGSQEDIKAEERRQQSLFLETTWSRQARLVNLAWPLRKNGTELCGKDVKNDFGILAIALNEIPRDYQDVAQTEHKIGNRPRILHVIPDSPADLAGMETGDEFMSIAREPIKDKKRSITRFRDKLDESAKTGLPVDFEVSRTGVTHFLTIKPEEVCSYDVIMTSDDIVNAFADGNNIIFTQGMMRFAQDDEELQLVIAHEIAHNAEGHIDKGIGNRLLGALIDAIALAYGLNTQGMFADLASMVFSQDFEREADYVGMYLLARAGINTSGVGEFWRRIAAEYPQSIKGSFTHTHPATAERYINIDAAHTEIADKLLKGLPLLPERKEGK